MARTVATLIGGTLAALLLTGAATAASAQGAAQGVGSASAGSGPPAAQAGPARPPARIGNIWGGNDHQIAPGAVVGSEKSAGVALPPAQQQQENAQVENEASKLLHRAQ